MLAVWLAALAAAAKPRDPDKWSKNFFDALDKSVATRSTEEDLMEKALDDDNLAGVRNALPGTSTPEPEAILGSLAQLGGGSFAQLRQEQILDRARAQLRQIRGATRNDWDVDPDDDAAKTTMSDSLRGLDQLGKQVEQEEKDFAALPDPSEALDQGIDKADKDDARAPDAESLLEEPAAARTDRKLQEIEEKTRRNKRALHERRKQEEERAGLKRGEAEEADEDPDGATGGDDRTSLLQDADRTSLLDELIPHVIKHARQVLAEIPFHDKPSMKGQQPPVPHGVNQKLNWLEALTKRNDAETRKRQKDEETYADLRDGKAHPAEKPSSLLQGDPDDPSDMLIWQDWGRKMHDMKQETKDRLQEVYAETAPSAEISDPRLATVKAH